MFLLKLISFSPHYLARRSRAPAPLSPLPPDRSTQPAPRAAHARSLDLRQTRPTPTCQPDRPCPRAHTPSLAPLPSTRARRPRLAPDVFAHDPRSLSTVRSHTIPHDPHCVLVPSLSPRAHPNPSTHDPLTPDSVRPTRSHTTHTVVEWRGGVWPHTERERGVRHTKWVRGGCLERGIVS